MKGKQVNPFYISGYGGEPYFCNRSTETKELIDNVNNGRNTVMYGWRRLGKSALLWHMANSLGPQGYLCIYVDLLGTKTMQQAVESIAQSAVRASQQKPNLWDKVLKMIGNIGAQLSMDPLSGMPTLTLGVDSRKKENGQQHLLGVMAFLADIWPNVVLILDEFQQILEYPDGPLPEATFRSAMQQFPQVRFVFSGSHRHLMASMFNDLNRPFYRSCATLSISPIPLEHYIPFIENWMKKGGKDIVAGQIETIYSWARGQTYYVQLICNLLYASEKGIDNALIQQLFRQCIAQDAPYCQHIHDLLTTKQRDLMRAMAREDVVASPTAHAFLEKYALGAASSVARALATLENKSIIIWNEDGYRIHDTLLSRWYAQL
ncbi:MAG: ATP-binding protein [Bacteroidetes bacterium]|nr:ATP-binding protein [Bacteroidota bacterium]